METVFLADAAGRILAEDLTADRDYPPLPRAIRDGFAVCSSGFSGSARIIGEVRAGQTFPHMLRAGETVEIMTGAPVPPGADAVVMVEHTRRDGEHMQTERTVEAGDFIVPAGAECRAGAVVVPAGTRLDFGHFAAAATIGADKLAVFRRPEVAIIATGDELVPIEQRPAPHQIRNSNSFTLAAQVERAGGRAKVLPVARDNAESTRKLVEQGLQSDLLLLSGGVSAGKYDLVESVLAELGAEFFFDRVLIQPGQPLVFGRARGTFFFGLPGNPASTMVTFEIFARAAIERLSGCRETPLPFVYARLASDFRHKPGLTRFLPARLGEGGRELHPIRWQGSGDVFAIASANAFLVAREDRECWAKGDWIEVLLR